MKISHGAVPLPATDRKTPVRYYENCYSAAFRLARKITKSRHNAEDVVQEAFEKAHRKESFSSYQHFIRWMATVTKSTSIDALRKGKRWLYLEDFKPLCYNLQARDYLPEQFLLQNEEEGLLRARISALKDIHRSIIYYKYYLDLSYKEISDRTGIKECTLRSRCHRALKILHRQYRDGTHCEPY